MVNPKNIKFFAEHILKENLTVIPQFHSHLEAMRNIGDIDLQITLSFSEANTISLDGPFSKQVDPTRYFFSYLFALDELIRNVQTVWTLGYGVTM